MPNYSHGTKVSLASAEEPPYLSVGTDVSAKYKGAFCEAKITEVNKHVKLRVLFDGCSGSYLIDDTDLKAGSSLETGTKIEARHPEKKQQTFIPATITKILDHSRYTVVFDDGDQCILRRNSICLKSGKHFAESETLDQLPLTNPEHFGNPVKVEQQNNHGYTNHQTPTNSKPVAATNTTTTTNTPATQPSTTASSTPAASGGLGRGRGGGKGRKRRESSNQNSKFELDDAFADSSQDSADADIGDSNVKYEMIEIGTRLMVQYGKGKVQNVYEAKVNKIETNSTGRTRYFVHYLGWNNRYDEYVAKNRIVSIVTDKENGNRDGRSRNHHNNQQTQPIDTISSNSSVTNTPTTASGQIVTNNNTSVAVTAANVIGSTTTTGSSSKDQKETPKNLKDKEIQPTKTRRSRQVDNVQVASTVTTASSINITSSSSTTVAQTTTVTNSTSTVNSSVVVTTHQKERKSKDKEQTTPLSTSKTRRSRHTDASKGAVGVGHSSSASSVSSSSLSSSITTTSSSTGGKDNEKDRDKDIKQEQAPVNSPATKESRSRGNNHHVTSESNKPMPASQPTPNSGAREKRETPAKTRRTRHIESVAHSSNSAAGSTTPASSAIIDKEEPMKTEKESKQSRESSKKEGRIESTKQIDSESKDRVTSKDKDAATNRLADREMDPTNPSTTTTLATTNQTKTIATSVSATSQAKTTVSSISTTSTSPSTLGSSSDITATIPVTRDIDKDKDKETKEPPAKVRRSRHVDASTGNQSITNSSSACSSSSASSVASSTSSSHSTTTPSSTSASNMTTLATAAASSSMTNTATPSRTAALKSDLRTDDLPTIDEPDCDKRISILQDKIMAIRQAYMALKTELADLDRRRKRPRLERANSDHIKMNSITCRN